MNCSNCNQITEAAAAFCGNCGQQLQLKLKAPLAPAAADNLAASLPSYAFTTQGHTGEVKALLALLFGITGIIGAMFMAVVGLALGISGIVMGTMSRSSTKRGLSTAGLGLSGVAILGSLGVWVYALNQYPKLNPATSGPSQPAAQNNTASVLTGNISTPCYSVGFAYKLNVSSGSESCDVQAYNGSEITTSTDAYKIYVSKSGITDTNTFTNIAKQALNKDVKDNLSNFNIVTEKASLFASSPAYIVNAYNKAQGVTVVEAAVLHKAGNGSSVFILVHATNARTADLNDLESGWQWK